MDNVPRKIRFLPQKTSDRLLRLWQRQIEGNHREPLLPDAVPETTCLNCGTRYRGHFCPGCGQSAKTQRFNTKQTLKHLLFIFTKFDDTFWHTTAELFYRPGHMIRDYIRGHRAEYLRPVQLLVCLITVYFVVVHLVFPEAQTDGVHHLVNSVDGTSAFRDRLPNDFMRSIYDGLETCANNVLISTLASISLLSLTCYFIYKRTELGRELNYAEHFYALVYINCQTLLISFFLLPYDYFTGKTPDGTIDFLAASALFVWIYSQFLRISWRRSLGLYILAYLSFVIIVVGILALVMAAVYPFLPSDIIPK